MEFFLIILITDIYISKILKNNLQKISENIKIDKIQEVLKSSMHILKIVL